MIKRFIVIYLMLALSMVTSARADEEPASEFILNAEIQWSPLNPLRGDKSPQAGQLWGDRTQAMPSGFLVKFRDGFSSPPHIHNVTYRGVVISGLVHNDDPDANNMWIPAGSFWTQPAGETHITSARGKNNIAYIEIEDGPCLVRPESQAFDNGERPVNIDRSNLVWLDAANIAWIKPDRHTQKAVEMAFLWGKPEHNTLNGSFVKLPAGFSGTIHHSGEDFRAVVVSGDVQYQDNVLMPGSYFGASEAMTHEIAVGSEETVIYIRNHGMFEITDQT